MSRIARICRMAVLAVSPAMLAPEARAEVSLPAIFGSHMVLQRDQKDKVWGKANPGDALTVTIAGQEKSTKAGDDGTWSVLLDPMPAGGPHTLAVKGPENTVTYDDVLVGEVWICSGQSNMEWPTAASKDFELDVASANDPQIRLITVPRYGSQVPRWTFEGSWKVCTPDNVGAFSAVGYFFGRQIHQTIGVPVGLIANAWGGSVIQGWMPRDLLESDPRFKPIVEDWDKKARELESPEARSRYEQSLQRYNAAVEKARAEGQRPPSPPVSPQERIADNDRPGNIYNGMLYPTIGFGIRGVIWYQGESDRNRGYAYRYLFPMMIKQWRHAWGQGDFSFYWAQLPNYDETRGPDTWADVRESQTRTMSLPHTGQAVTIDIGEANNLHPRNKEPVGERLARWALANDYGLDIHYQSPTYKSSEKQGGKILLKIDHVGDGLRTYNDPDLKGFTIAGADQKFVPATAKFLDDATIEVSAEGVADPVAARYGWANAPNCNVVSRKGLPLTPFRTDDWKTVTSDRF